MTSAPSPRRRLLLLSNSRDPEGHYLRHPQTEIRVFLGTDVRTVLFIPYAGVTVSPDAYAERVRAPFGEMGYRLESIHESADPVRAVREAESIAVGGGNTFHLLTRLYEEKLLEAIRDRVAAGVPYIGWSAGSVVTCPTIATTNDMPIIEPPSMRALGLVSFQINAHFTDAHPPGFRGETRRERLAEYLAVNPGAQIVALPEGTMLRVEAESIQPLGAVPVLVFAAKQEPREVQPGSELGIAS